MGKAAPYAALAFMALVCAAPAAAQQAEKFCIECLQIRVGTPHVVRGPFPDELDSAFTALRLPDGRMRGFTANGSTYAVDGANLLDMAGSRQEVLQAGPPGSVNDCGRWLTSVARTGDTLLGFVHQERACDYEQDRTEKSMAIATSADDGITWTDLGTVISGRDLARPTGFTGEGDCSLVNPIDGYFYAYCLRNSDWQTIVARAPVDDPTEWRKFFNDSWSEHGLGGEATAIGFLGTGAGYIRDFAQVATVTTDQWFGGIRLSLSADKVTFQDLVSPLILIDGAEWERPADTDLLAYATILNPEYGSNTVGQRFLLAYILVPAGEGFESRHLVLREVSLTLGDESQPEQVGLALTRWQDPESGRFITSTSALTGDRRLYQEDAVVAHVLTRAPVGIESVKLAECGSDRPGHLDHLLAEDGTCESEGFERERTAGWLYATGQPGTFPVYRCMDDATRSHFASAAPDCEGLGRMEFVLGYGLEP
jgi:hypothetical protein